MCLMYMCLISIFFSYSPNIMIDACSFKHNSSESSSNTFNIFQCEDDLLFSINIGIENTKNMNKFVLVNNSDRGLLYNY